MWDILIKYIIANPIELIGFCFTVVSIWLNTQQNPWGWGVGILGIGCYLYLSFSVGLWGSFLLNIYFLIISIYGWYWWKLGKGKEKFLPITYCTLRELGLLFILAIFLCMAIVGLIHSYQSATPIQYWDAEATAFSLIGQWLLARKKMENWLVWLLVNVQFVFIYYYQNLFITSLLYIILFILALRGWSQWKKSVNTTITESV